MHAHQFKKLICFELISHFRRRVVLPEPKPRRAFKEVFHAEAYGKPMEL
jgi:hypothetical protein